MCCFSKPADVSNTSIFARPSKEGRQYVVYSMTVKAKDDLAMILPIPTPKESKEGVVQFVNLEKYTEFFDELASGFPLPKSTRDPNVVPPAPLGQDKKLEVVQVGSFVASFAPSQADLHRLDEQFRLPAGVWDKLPQYKEWGFAVFQLKKGAHRLHPMAFEFPRRDAKRVFFPTVHIHDGEVHEKAGFDHTLYLQTSELEAVNEWSESDQTARQFMAGIEKCKGIVEPDAHVYKRTMKGELKNQDTLV